VRGGECQPFAKAPRAPRSEKKNPGLLGAKVAPVVPGNTTPETPATKPTSGAGDEPEGRRCLFADKSASYVLVSPTRRSISAEGAGCVRGTRTGDAKEEGCVAGGRAPAVNDAGISGMTEARAVGPRGGPPVVLGASASPARARAGRAARLELRARRERRPRRGAPVRIRRAPKASWLRFSAGLFPLWSVTVSTEPRWSRGGAERHLSARAT
jgi:hypothetical protein